MLQNNSTDIENFDNENVIDIDINHGNNNDFISLWHYGIDAYDSKEYNQAIYYFQALGKRSKSLYNIAICYLQLGIINESLEYWKRAIEADPYLTIAHYQMASHSPHSNIYHYIECIKSIRNLDYIDYSQMGLSVVIYTSELWYNLAIIDDISNRTSHLLKASSVEKKGKEHEQWIREALRCSKVSELFFPSFNQIFRIERGNLSSSNNWDPIGESIIIQKETDGKTVQIDESFSNLFHLEREKGKESKSINENEKNVITETKSNVNNQKNHQTHNDSKNLNLKVFSNDGKIRWMKYCKEDEMRDNEMTSMKNKIHSKMGKGRLKYKDKEGDWINIIDGEDWMELVDNAETNIMRIFLFK